MYTFTLDSKLTIQLHSKAKVWGLGLWLRWQSDCLGVHEPWVQFPALHTLSKAGYPVILVRSVQEVETGRAGVQGHP